MLTSARILLILLCISGSELLADTLRVCAYNSLNFHGSQDLNRADDFRRVIQSISPDIVCMNEIHAAEAIDVLLANAYDHQADDWAAAPFVNGPDTDNALFYRASRVSFISQRMIATELRNIAEYVVQPINFDSTHRFRLYSAHLKASSGVDNENQRRRECEALRPHLDALPPGAHFMMMGDFNLYGASEPAYQLLLSPDPSPNGQLFDPINMPGEWNNAVSFASIHTQSTRSGSLGDGGATGGLDDRFDFILVSQAWMDTAGMYVIPASYHAHGNDGLHFNESINDGFNAAVPDSVADALHVASDHLPVVADFVVRQIYTSTPVWSPVAQNIQIVECYPNPFNPVLNLRMRSYNHGSGSETATLRIYDLLGRTILTRDVPFQFSGSQELQVDFSAYSAGAYLISLQTGGIHELRSVRLVK